jgi:hypothetical protein
MKAAALGHQYLNVKSSNENDIYFNSGRFRGGRKNQQIHSRQQQNDGQINSILTASDPLSRRSVAINENSESNIPSATIYGRSYSACNDLYVVYEQQPIKHTDGGRNVFFRSSLITIKFCCRS